MIDTSKLNKSKFIAAKVIERMGGSDINTSSNFEKYINSCRSKEVQRSVEIKIEAISRHGEYQRILDGGHHFKCAIQEVIASIERNLPGACNSSIQNPSNKAKNIRELTDELDNRILPALAGIQSIDESEHAFEEYEAIKRKFNDAISKIDSGYPNKKTAVIDRLDRYQPPAKELIESSKHFCSVILNDIYGSECSN